jgi:hypothetical protein
MQWDYIAIMVNNGDKNIKNRDLPKTALGYTPTIGEWEFHGNIFFSWEYMNSGC